MMYKIIIESRDFTIIIRKYGSLFLIFSSSYKIRITIFVGNTNLMSVIFCPDDLF